ncbi:protein of unknown function [Burkholderia multivorans]
MGQLVLCWGAGAISSSITLGMLPFRSTGRPVVSADVVSANCMEAKDSYQVIVFKRIYRKQNNVLFEAAKAMLAGFSARHFFFGRSAGANAKRSPAWRSQARFHGTLPSNRTCPQPPLRLLVVLSMNQVGTTIDARLASGSSVKE